MAFTHGMYRVKEAVAGRRTYRLLSGLRQSQWLSREAVRAEQLAALRGLLLHAARRSPYYREVFASAKVRPDDVVSWDDWEGVPLLDREALAARQADIVVPDPPERVVSRSTSGSSGRVLTVICGLSVLSYGIANWMRAREWWGLRAGDRCLRVMGALWSSYPRRVQRWVAHAKRAADLAVGTYAVSAWATTEQDLDRHCRLLLRLRPKVVYGYGVSLYLMADYMRQSGMPLHGYSPTAVIYTSEMLHAGERRVIEEVLGCPTVSEYGCVEAGTIACDCPSGSAHVSDEAVYVEVVDPEGRPVWESEGEVVITHLHSHAAPLIRYRVGDLAVAAAPDHQCACGRGLSVLRSVVGRRNAVLRSPTGGIAHPESIDAAIRLCRGTRRYRVIERAPGALEVLLELSGAPGAEASDVTAARIVSHIGDGFSVVVRHVERLPGDARKHRWVVPMGDQSGAEVGGQPPA